MGDRIGVIRRVLAPLTEVRILVPQPTPTYKFQIVTSFIYPHKVNTIIMS